MKVDHELKIRPEFFEDVRDGRKPFEVRWNDRDYQVGQVLLLKEWDPAHEGYTGRTTIKIATYVGNGQAGQRPGIQGVVPGYVVIGLREGPPDA